MGRSCTASSIFVGIIRESLCAREPPEPVDGQRHLIEGREGGLGPVEGGDIPAVHRNLDVLLNLFPLKHELLESGAHEPPNFSKSSSTVPASIPNVAIPAAFRIAPRNLTSAIENGVQEPGHRVESIG
jgi:hypothetical protein